MSQTISLPISDEHDPFATRLASDGQNLHRQSLQTLQLNMGKMCNLACHHCHVEAGPGRTEIMPREVCQSILDWIDAHRSEMDLQTVDLTGGAPEMNPHFKMMVSELRKRDLHVIDRCNLTILLEDGYEDMAQFLADHQVEIVASLPCYLEDNVDKQRGKGVYSESVQVLKQLNDLGYGMPGTGLQLSLVFNPVGYSLPPAQEGLERDYKFELDKRFGIQFNSLFTITNMPFKRFEHALIRDGKLDEYLGKLYDAHKAENVDAVMCKSLVSIGWQGSVYDCDFNQMLLMPLAYSGGSIEEHHVEKYSRKLWDYTPKQLIGLKIQTGKHCFGCTAGGGSSCTGALN